MDYVQIKYNSNVSCMVKEVELLTLIFPARPTWGIVTFEDRTTAHEKANEMDTYVWKRAFKNLQQRMKKELFPSYLDSALHLFDHNSKVHQNSLILVKKWHNWGPKVDQRFLLQAWSEEQQDICCDEQSQGTVHKFLEIRCVTWWLLERIPGKNSYTWWLQCQCVRHDLLPTGGWDKGKIQQRSQICNNDWT